MRALYNSNPRPYLTVYIRKSVTIKHARYQYLDTMGARGLRAGVVYLNHGFVDYSYFLAYQY